MSAVLSGPGHRDHARRAGAMVALALHAAVVAGLLSYEPARTALLTAAPLIVDIIAPPQPPAPPKVEPPRPKPVAKREVPRPVEPEPILTMPAEAPAPVAAPAPPAPIVPPALPAPVVSAPSPAPAAVPVSVPIFNADYLSNPAPPYPAPSRRIGEQGRVILRVFVTPAGSAEQVEIRTSSGFTRLDDSARDTVRRWKFVPARRGSEPVAAWVLIPITFRLES